MASYALLLAISGVAYSAVSKMLSVAPKINLPKFRTFFSINSGWGTILLDADQLEIKLVEGFMQLDKLQVTWRSQTYHLQPDLLIRAGASTVIKLSQGMERR
jgi:hypothetical protein